MTGIAVVLSVVAGMAGSVQVAVMSRFGDRIGILQALAFSALGTALITAVVLLVVRQSLDGYAAGLRQPPWLWIGAVMGAIVVFTITFAGPRLGTAATIGLLIAGQLAMGAVIDRFGLFGVDRIALHWPRLVGIVLLGAGAALSLRK
ncbi:MAG TPA: DMT family transporter [Gaiellaceae bacterium]|nr:DMT family transporter [Gaiellaceae bacterium]